ncbi:MAG TPA: ABC transporter substrate-binding protein [Solirubrobacter sp.]|nr:ABC transporter substrate-binding protein [Solirubrobacter sp.]
MGRQQVMSRCALLGVLAAAVLAGCGNSESASSSSDSSSSASDGGTITAKLGMIDSLTGLTAGAGTANACGAQVAVKAVNAGKTQGTDGVKLDLSLVDDQSTPAVAAQDATKLTSQGIKLFVGGSNSATVLAAMPIINDAGGMHTGGTSKSPDFLTAGKYVVRINSDSAQDSRAVADFVDGRSPKSVTFVAARGAFGEGAVTAVKADIDPSIKAKTVYVGETATNFDAVITDLVKSKPDVVVFIFGNSGQQVAWMRDWQQSGLKSTLVAYPGNLGGSTAEAAGGAADGVITLDIYAPFFENEANTTLLDAFKAYGGSIGECKGKTVDRQFGLTYAQVLLMAQAISKAKSTDPAKLRETMLANTWSLPQGDVKFQPNGQVDGQYTTFVGKGTDLVKYTG